MSSHWNPKYNGPARRKPPARRGRQTAATLSWGEIRLTVLGGLFLGLAYVLVPLEGAGEIVFSGSGAGSETAANGAVEVRNPRAVRIVDGDTFAYQGDKYRIADIDTPEVQGRCAKERALAAEATDRMEQLLRKGPFELHPVERDEDRYGRKLRIATRDGVSLGDQLVAEGLARTWSGRRQPWCG